MFKNPTSSVRIDKRVLDEISQFCAQTGLPKPTAIQRIWDNYKNSTDYHILMSYPRRQDDIVDKGRK